ncbi:ectoine hydroxylase [Amycolatopsis sp. NPDC005232]|uniref:ectoine hydroxylase n=1 Tax=Amycolatopsis sp. NPDC005232 TaxID=3157027 RepID=UPI0033AE0B11
MTTTGTTTEDRYPTRIGGEPALLRREVPAVWPGRLREPFTPAELAAHAERGYSIVPSSVTEEELDLLRAELDRLCADETLAADERVVREKASGAVRSIFEVHRMSPLIARLVRDPRVLDRARQLLGSEVYVHQSRINCMPGFRGKGFYWHSDFETWHAEDGMPVPRAVSLSLALTDNHPFNGGLMVMPGSHREFAQCAGATPGDHYRDSLKEQQVGVPDETTIARLAAAHGINQFTGPAGHALWFDANLMHGSADNITPYPRSNVFVVFNSVENTLREPYAAASPRPPFVAARDFTPLMPTH